MDDDVILVVGVDVETEAEAEFNGTTSSIFATC